jgi:hypothetical protein
MPKRKKKTPKKIVARQVIVTDKDGNGRILMDGGGKEGRPSICMLSPSGASVQIIAQPDGNVTVTLDQGKNGLMVSIGRAGIIVNDTAGRLGVAIGDEHNQQPSKAIPAITLYENGQMAWTSRKRRKPKKA